MPTNIDDFKVFVQAEINKVQSGEAISVDEFNSFANQSQLVPYEQDYNVFVSSQKKIMSQYLNSFLTRKEPFTVDSFGNAALPDDYQHTASMRAYYVRKGQTSVQIPVREVDNIAWGEIQISSLNIANKRFPKYTEYPDRFEFLPKNTLIAFLDYFKKPTKPIWNFTIVEDTQVYNPSGSVNFDFDEFAMNRIAGHCMVFIGTNLQSDPIIKAGMALIQSSTSL